MKQSLIRKLKKIQTRYKEIEKILIDPITSSDQKKFRLLSIEYSQLTDIVMYFRRWLQVQKDILNAETLLNDLDLRSIVKDELNKCYLHQSILEHKIKISLLPKDINDKRGCFLEIRSGTGGNEASLFAGELFKMYTRYAENMNWKIKIISRHNGDQGGYKEIILIIPDKDTYSYLKYESGGHRVQRVPDTESQGRVHTSTCTVAVIPKIPEKEMPIINKEELRIDTFRSSGAGGQHVNTTDSAIRITHIPTGIVVECQDERSQHKNKAKALSVLGSRLCSLELNRRQKKESLIRKSLLGSGERSDRIRTYNYQQGRITDHRINLTVYKLNEIMNGKLDILINPIMQKYYDDQLSVILGDDL